jgi:hypothetical protein
MSRRNSDKLTYVNPNERMKFHLRQRRYSSNDVDHRKYHDILQHDQKVAPEQAASHETQAIISHKHHHEAEYHEPVYEVHLYDEHPPQMHHHHPSKSPTEHELSLKLPSQHLHHHEHSTPIISPAEESFRKELSLSHKHPSQAHEHSYKSTPQISPLQGSHQPNPSQHLHYHESSVSIISPAESTKQERFSVKHPIHSIKVTPRANEGQLEEKTSSHLIAKAPEEQIVPSAQAARIAKPGS